MIWVISTGKAFWQHNISRHPKRLLQHLTVIYSSFIYLTITRGKVSQKEEVKLCVCVCLCLCIFVVHGGLTIFIQRRCDLGD